MPVNTMATPASSAAAITSPSRTEPPGWMTAVAPASIADRRPSANGKEGVRGDDRALGARLRPSGGLGGVERLEGGDARRSTRDICPAPTPGGRAVLDIDDGVRLHVLGDPPGDLEVGHFGGSRRAPGDDLEACLIEPAAVAVLHQQAARDGAHRQAFSRADRAVRRRSSAAGSSSTRRSRSPRRRPRGR